MSTRRLACLPRLVTSLGLLSATAFAQEPISRITVRPDGSASPGVAWFSFHPIARDGRHVVFATATGDLVVGDTNGRHDIFVRDLATGVTTRVSASNGEAEANRGSFHPSISADGRFVAFASAASNLISNDTNNFDDIFLRDRDPDGNGLFDESNSTTRRISRKVNGTQSNGLSDLTAIAADGSYVAFQCDGPNIVPGVDNNGDRDVFVRDRQAGVTILASLASDGSQGNDDSFEPSISGDGTHLSFTSDADNFFVGDGNQRSDVFVRDLVAGTLTHVSRNALGVPFDRSSYTSWLSGDGSVVVFTTDAWNVAPEDTNFNTDAILVDLATGAIEVISENCIGFSANQRSLYPSCSGDGLRVVFFSEASDLVSDAIGGEHLYVHDRSIAWPEAAHASYGSGWPGTLGIPSFTATGDPEFNTTIDLLVDNSSGAWNVGFLFIGASEAQVPTNRGGTLLVAPFLMLPLALPPAGWSEPADIPGDVTLCGAEFDLQMIQFDPGASHGMSFTPGLKLVIGR